MLSFKECNGVEIVSGETGHLVISEEELSPLPLKVTYPVLVYTPDMNRPLDCHHIELGVEEARDLYHWLQDFFFKTP